MLEVNRVYCGDCLELMKEIPDGSVNCVVTSPPYYGLRDYGIPEQIGLESAPEQYIAKMVEVFREVRRVLRNDGTLWLNLGETYAAARSYKVPDNKYRDVGNKIGHTVPDGFKQKDLIGIPWRVAFALQADRWYLRQDIIWAKPNPMPESVRDRCTKSHEYIFLLSKSPRYYYDAKAIAEPVSESTITRLMQPTLNAQAGSDRVPEKTNGSMKAVGGIETRNRRSVWTVATQPFSGAHFATFPPRLIEPCILAGCPLKGIVLDPFAGTGTTVLTALRLGRNAIGIEINPEYCAMRRNEIDAELAQTRLAI